MHHCVTEGENYNSQKAVRSTVLGGLPRGSVSFSAVVGFQPDVVYCPGGRGGPVWGRASWSRPRDVSPGGGKGE